MPRRRTGELATTLAVVDHDKLPPIDTVCDTQYEGVGVHGGDNRG
jgi:hypothetical protein